MNFAINAGKNGTINIVVTTKMKDYDLNYEDEHNDEYDDIYEDEHYKDDSMEDNDYP
jgi:hypothetical protein